MGLLLKHMHSFMSNFSRCLYRWTTPCATMPVIRQAIGVKCYRRLAANRRGPCQSALHLSELYCDVILLTSVSIRLQNTPKRLTFLRPVFIVLHGFLRIFQAVLDALTLSLCASTHILASRIDKYKRIIEYISV